jgi:hypothetical protein
MRWLDAMRCATLVERAEECASPRAFKILLHSAAALALGEVLSLRYFPVRNPAASDKYVITPSPSRTAQLLQRSFEAVAVVQVVLRLQSFVTRNALLAAHIQCLAQADPR